jgi:hypothetical protein
MASSPDGRGLKGDFVQIDAELDQRDKLLRLHLARISEGDPQPTIIPKLVGKSGKVTSINPALALAATDVFVEKAQHILNARARWLKWMGVILIFTAIALPCTGAILLYRDLHPFRLLPSSATAFDLTVIVLRSTAFAGLLAAAIFIVFSFSKACLDEAMTLYNRRHALRFGRLYVYLRAGQIKTVKELEDAFRWNEIFASSFGQVRPDKMPRSPTNEIIRSLPELVRALKPQTQGEGEQKES